MDPQEREDGLRETARAMAARVPEEERATFIKDFVEVMSQLNVDVDVRMHRMAQEVVPLIQLYAPHRPSDVQALLDGYVQTVRKLAEEAMGATSGIASHAIRAVITAALKDVLERCVLATTELAIRADARKNVRQD